MCSTIARKESLAACMRSSFTPMVAYQPASSTSGVSGPGVWNWGAGMLRPLIRSKRNAAYMGPSMPVTQTSPSPWAAWASPQEKRALQHAARAGVGWSPSWCGGVHVAAERSRRHDSRLLGARRAHAHRPEERLYGDDDVVLQERVIPVGEVEDLEVGVGEILGQQPEAWQYGGPAPACRMDIDDLDGQYVTGLGVGQRDGTREWVEAVPVEARENAGVGIGPDLSVRDLP